MDTDTATLNHVMNELRTLREQLDRIERTITGRDGETAAPAASHSGALIRRALMRMAREPGRRSRVMKLEPELLRGFCLKLLDPAIDTSEALAWLRGKTADAPSKSAAYRFVQRFCHAVDVLEAGRPDHTAPPGDGAGPADSGAIRRAIEQVRGSSRNGLLELPAHQLAEALERAGFDRSAVKSRAARRWLAEQAGVAVNNNAFHCLRESVRSVLFPRGHTRREGAEGGAR